MFSDDFNRRQREFDRDFNITRAIVLGIFFLVFVSYLVFGVFAFKFFTGVGEQIRQHGLKSMVEEVWNGEQEDK